MPPTIVLASKIAVSCLVVCECSNSHILDYGTDMWNKAELLSPILPRFSADSQVKSFLEQECVR